MARRKGADDRSDIERMIDEIGEVIVDGRLITRDTLRIMDGEEAAPTPDEGGDE